MSHRGDLAQPLNDTFSSLVQAICDSNNSNFKCPQSGRWPVSGCFPVLQDKAGFLNQTGCRGIQLTRFALHRSIYNSLAV